ncbi:hypothetical protein HOY80DRAFT_741278 [Tuber brumale]|nr:hypothetical protein HOY80DRAFT_741278 [Tuber brumale]
MLHLSQLPRRPTNNGTPGSLIRPPYYYTPSGIRQGPGSKKPVTIDTTLYPTVKSRVDGGSASMKLSQPKGKLPKLRPRTDSEMENWFEKGMSLTREDKAACEEAKERGDKLFRVIQRKQGNIIEVFLNIDIETHNSHPHLAGLQALSLDQCDALGASYQQVDIGAGELYAALDRNYRRLLVVFANPASAIYGEEVGERIAKQAVDNITKYSEIQPPRLPGSIRHKSIEDWLLRNPQHYAYPSSRCGVFHWGIWAQQGHEDLGPVLTRDTNDVGSYTRGDLQALLASFQNITQLKRLLLGAIDRPQRDTMQSTIKLLPDHFRNLWTNCDNECFSLRACLINVVTEPHLDQGDLDWTMSAPLGQFEGAGLCVFDLERCLHFPAGSIAGIRGCKLIHFTRLWTGSRLCLVSTMHGSLLRYVFGSQKEAGAGKGQTRKRKRDSMNVASVPNLRNEGSDSESYLRN